MANKIVIWQDNIITKARYEMSSIEKNILYMVLAQLKKDDTADTVYRIHAIELGQIMGVEIKYGNLLKATGKLVSRFFQTTLPNGDVLQATFVSSAKYLKGQGIIEIELSRNVRPFFFELKEKFTTYQLNTALSLHSKYSKRLYELFSMHKNFDTPFFRVSVKDLKRQLGIIDEKNVDRYEKWTHFKKAVLDPADKEINSCGEIAFTYEIIKKGRSVEEIEFQVKYLDNPRLVKIETDDAPIYVRLQDKYKLRPDQARKVLEKFSLEHIHKTLHDIQMKMINHEINNVGAYVAKTFEVST